jgi:hypothetical protein
MTVAWLQSLVSSVLQTRGSGVVVSHDDRVTMQEGGGGKGMFLRWGNKPAQTDAMSAM